MSSTIYEIGNSNVPLDKISIPKSSCLNANIFAVIKLNTLNTANNPYNLPFPLR